MAAKRRAKRPGRAARPPDEKRPGRTARPPGDRSDSQQEGASGTPGSSRRVGRSELESYFARMDTPYEATGENTWLTHDAGFDLAVSLSGSAVALRVELLSLSPVPAGNRERFFQTLLELNAAEMTHGAYGVQGDIVVVTGAVSRDGLGFGVFRGTVEGIILAAKDHLAILRSLTV